MDSHNSHHHMASLSHMTHRNIDLFFERHFAVHFVKQKTIDSWIKKLKLESKVYDDKKICFIYTLKKFYYMLTGHKINWLTDHKALLHVKAEANFKERINR